MKNILTKLLFVPLILATVAANAQNGNLTTQKVTLSKNAGTVTKDVSFSRRMTISDEDGQGFKKFNKYVEKNIVNNSGVKGKVTLGFTSEKDGTISNMKVVKSLNRVADAEALRLLKSYKGWEPVIIDGKPERSTLTVPIDFGSK